jgi:WD40 repeat protein
MKRLSLLGIGMLLIASMAAGVAAQDDDPVTPPENAPLTVIHRIGHGQVHRLAWSPDGETIAAADDDGIWLYERESLNSSPRLLPHAILPDAESVMAFNADGSVLAVGSGDPIFAGVESRELILWNPQMGTPLPLSYRTTITLSLAFQPDGNLLGIREAYRLVLLDYNHPDQLRQLLPLPDQVLPIIWEFTSDGKNVIGYNQPSPEASDKLLAWTIPDDFESGEEVEPTVLTEFTGSVNDIAISPDNHWLAAAQEDGTIWLWDNLAQKEWGYLKGHTAGVLKVAFSPDGTLLSASRDGTVMLWDVTTGTILNTLVHGAPVTDAVFSPDGSEIASGSWDGTIRIWDTRTSAELASTPSSNQIIQAVAFCPDGYPLATGDDSGKVQLWDIERGELLATTQTYTGSVNHVVYSPDGRLLASGGTDGTVHVWDAGSLSEKWVLPGHQREITALVFDASGTRLASGSRDGTYRVWDMVTGQLLDEEYAVYDDVRDVIFDKSGALVVASQGRYGMPRWSIYGADRRESYPGWLADVIQSPKGCLAVTTAFRSAFWNIEKSVSAEGLSELPENHIPFLTSAGEARLLEPDALWLEQDPERPINAAAFSPDGSQLALAYVGIVNIVHVPAAFLECDPPAASDRSRQ